MGEPRRGLPILAAALLATLGVVIFALGRDLSPRVRYFDETHRMLREPFLDYFDEHGGLATFGVPLTDAYTTSDGTLVQTFDRVQMQLTVRGMELAPIGVALQLGEPVDVSAVDPAFRPAYEAQGGAAFFGLPLGPARVEAGLLVQDFERARLVHDAEGRVRLANLGHIYLAAFPPPADGQAAIHPYGTPGPPPALHPSLTVQFPAVEQGQQQSIYLMVVDGEGRPVPGAQALAVLRYDRATAEVTLPDTDANGLSSATFVVPPATPGSRVIIEAHVLIGDTFQTVETTYLQWW